MLVTRISFALVSCAAALPPLAGCASSRYSEEGLFARITPYRIEIVQGNVVTREQASRVRPGMTRAQVRDVLGTPLISDAFHSDRWDYLFTLRRQGLETQRRSVVVWFEGDALKSIEAPELPSERDFVQTISVSERKVEAKALELSDEQRKALPVPPRRETPPAEPSGPLRSYPPLEGS